MTADPFRPNQLIPGTNYRYLRVLGEGGQGIVVLAADDFLQTDVVIKFVHAAHAPYLSSRIRDEARTLAKLKHPGIVRVLGGGMTTEDSPRGYFVMECLEGDTLYSVLRRQASPFPVHLCLEITMDLLEALDFAHCAPHSLIHRDIKPGNIFMARIPPKLTRPIVLDFGLAQLFEQASRATGKRFVGTLEYAAPEQLLGKTLTPRADLYAVGLVLYELVTGRHPFAHAIKTQDRAVIARAHLEEVPRRLSTLGFDLDPALDQLVFSALEKDPTKRPRSAHDFLTKLKAIHTRLEMLHPEPKSHDKTEEEPLETLWARMGISAARTGPSSLVSGATIDSRPRIETVEEPARAQPPVSPSREELAAAKTSPAPTEELPQTAHHRVAMRRFRAAVTDTTPPFKDVSHAPVVQSAAQRIVDKHGSILFPLLGVLLGLPIVFGVYRHQKKNAPATVVETVPKAMPSEPTPASSARIAVTAATSSAPVVLVAPPPPLATPRQTNRELARPHASVKPAATKLPGSGLDDPKSAPPPDGFELLKGAP